MKVTQFFVYLVGYGPPKVFTLVDRGDLCVIVSKPLLNAGQQVKCVRVWPLFCWTSLELSAVHFGKGIVC